MDITVVDVFLESRLLWKIVCSKCQWDIRAFSVDFCCFFLLSMRAECFYGLIKLLPIRIAVRDCQITIEQKYLKNSK